MLCREHLFPALAAAMTLVAPVRADSPPARGDQAGGVIDTKDVSYHDYNWKFVSSFSSSFSACSTKQIQTIPITGDQMYPVNTTTQPNYQGTPPFWVISYPESGIVDLQYVGTDPNNLSWKVNHPPGTNLIMTVIDGNNHTAGFPQQMFTVDADSKSATTCWKTDPKDGSIPTIISNYTSSDNLKTCSPWGMHVTGGVPPYSVTIAALNSPVITNVTGGDGEDRFTWIDRANPGVKVIASVTDSTGAFGVGTQFIPTNGITNTSCPGINTSWDKNDKVEAQITAAKKAADAEKKAQQTRTIVGAVVGVTGGLLLGVLAYLLFRRHRARVARERAIAKEFANAPEKLNHEYRPYNPEIPTPVYLPARGGAAPGYDEEGAQGLRGPRPSMRSAMTPMTPAADMQRSFSTNTHGQPMRGAVGHQQSFNVPAQDPISPYTHDQPGVPLTPMNRKAREAAADRARAREMELNSPAVHMSEYEMRASGAGVSRGRSVATSAGTRSNNGTQLSPTAEDSEDGSAIVIQHRDMGAQQMVVELPPAYDSSFQSERREREVERLERKRSAGANGQQSPTEETHRAGGSGNGPGLM